MWPQRREAVALQAEPSSRARHRGFVNDQSGQGSVEFALVIGLYVFAFFMVIQLGLIAMMKHELNHLAYNAARLWSIKANNEQGDLDESIYHVARVYRNARGDSSALRLVLEDAMVKLLGQRPVLSADRDYGEGPHVTFIANTLQGEIVSLPEEGVRFFGWIPILMPGIAQMIVDPLDWGATVPPICRSGGVLPLHHLFNGPLGRGQGLAACWAREVGLPTMRAVPVEIFIPIEPEPALAPDENRPALIFGCGDGEDDPPCYDNDY